jgi:sporulation protein YlmC with PRC-barrel domain
MEIPLKAEVFCADGLCGYSVGVIFNPINQVITHVVIQMKDVAATEVLVPVDKIREGTALHIKLRCTRQALAALEPFVKIRFVSGHYAHFATGYEPDATWLWPYTLADEEQFGHYESFESIPHGELAVHRGNQVMATDGPVGTVEEFIVTRDNHHLTHMVLRKEEKWGENDVTVPVTAVARVENDVVYLTLDTESVTQQQFLAR